jgi:N-acetylneuraminate synthase/N,N'-diacetyllegionaminate synthase
MARHKIVLEIGGNAQGEGELARAMVRGAAQSGAWGVKLQAYRTDNFVSRDNQPAFDELKADETPLELIAELIGYARSLSLACGVTVFDSEGIRLAEEKKASFIKLSSGDLNNLPLLRECARSPIPLVLSAGCAWESEVRRALSLLRSPPLALLQCSSLYPCPPESANLAVMGAWLERGLPAGLSDHTEGVGASLAALQMGAVMVEKHFTTDRSLPGGDNFMSILPDEAARLSDWEKEPKTDPRESPYWGDPVKKPLPGERPELIRRFATARRALAAGERLRESSLRFLRISTEPPLVDYVSPDEDFSLWAVKRGVPEGAPVVKSDLEKIS